MSSFQDQLDIQRNMIQSNVERWPKNRQKACKKTIAKIEAALKTLSKEEQAACATLVLLDIQQYFADVQDEAEGQANG